MSKGANALMVTNEQSRNMTGLTRKTEARDIYKTARGLPIAGYRSRPLIPRYKTLFFLNFDFMRASFALL